MAIVTPPPGIRKITFATDDARFVACLPWTLREEGGDSDDKHDPGGCTHEGIIQSEYNVYRRLHGLPIRSVFKADNTEVDQIYYVSYWKPWCSIMPAGVDLDFFDNSVNEGPHAAIIILQRALGVDADGHIGIITRGALTEQTQGSDHTIGLLEKLKAARAAYYRGLRIFRYFGKDWIGRDDRISRVAEQMAS
jgi:lysozyme family protein